MNKPTILPNGIIIPSSTNFLADVDKYVEEKLYGAHVDASIITDIAISVSELVNNAIIHGNGSNVEKQVEINLTVSASELKISVQDQGCGFDYDHLPDPIDDQNLLREVGRGLFIVKNFVDDVKVLTTPSGGTRVEIVKKL
ncbi:MAG: ATP-binding protein [FCB group bacterium]|nr:ATP-binding protein [FCB group bacterium]